QADTDEADALDYAETNFTSSRGNATVAQIVVRDENVLDRKSLLSVLEYEQALRANETINETLVEEDAIRSVADVVAKASIRQDRAIALQNRSRELNETRVALREGLDTLAQNPNASTRAVFDAANANTSVTLTGEDFQTFDAATIRLREARATGNRSAVEAAYRRGTRGVLADEYDALAANRSDLQDGIEPSLDARIDAIESANESRIDDLVGTVLSDGGNRTNRALRFVPDHYEPGSTETNATLVLVTQHVEETSFAAGKAPEHIEDSQGAMETIAENMGGDGGSYLVFGSGVIADEIQRSMIDSVLLVGPLAIAFVLMVLVLAYRDLLDVLLGLLGIGGVLVWTFGAMGWLGIDFSQPFIVVVVLLIGLSIDYAIHVVMRYREERSAGGDDEGPTTAMTVALGSVGVALVYVTATTVIGFLSNLASPLSIFRQIGIVSAIGIVATLGVFGVFLPALKVELDSFLEAHGIERTKGAPGTNGGVVSRVLDVGATLATKAPAVVLVVALLVTAGGVYGATQVDTSFAQEDFLAEDPPDWLKDLPEPLAPGDYTAEQGMAVLNDHFVREDTESTILVRGEVTDRETLDRLHDARETAADEAVTRTYSNGEAAITDPLSAMERAAAENESFARTLSRADTDSDGVPDRNLTAVYDAFYRTAPEEAANTIYRSGGEYRALRMVVSVDGAAAGEDVVDGMDRVAAVVDGDGLTATTTGDVIVNQVTADGLLETVLTSLVIALGTVFVFLSIVYRFTEGTATLGAVTVVPVAFTMAWVLGAMALLDIPFNIVTGMITGLTIGLGVDYSIHVSERFHQELIEGDSVPDALHASVTGTGGALLSSATTTASGFAVLIAALLPFLQTFGVITALTIAFALVASVFVLPSLLALWAELPGVAPETAEGVEPAESPAPSDVAGTAPIDPGDSPGAVGRAAVRKSSSGA
ncbi:MAG TPA: MMPL family transporter, partial [Natrialbaceae archaeon]|nr:MMPL family transporter [Natrialbaceae archaeon]